MINLHQLVVHYLLYTERSHISYGTTTVISESQADPNSVDTTESNE